ncbi:MAG: alpha-amylase family glycosyl hydrolase [Pirellulales bacterium]
MSVSERVVDEQVPSRRRGLGAEVCRSGVHFRVWAPGHRCVELLLGGDLESAACLAAEGDGYFSGLVARAAAGSLYAFRLDGLGPALADPASRFQPEGPRGPSQVVDPGAFDWQDRDWAGVGREGHVIYELHVGTFTREATWRAAQEQLPGLADLGVTLVQVMPVCEFPGRFGWSYDPANLFAPSHRYGGPDDVRRFVDAAHACGLGVLLDVIYNHIGSVGEELLRAFTDKYFSTRHKSEWGTAFNLDEPAAREVRAFLLENVRYWIDEFHLDGFRIDATQSIFDDSRPHFLLEVARAARAAAAGRGILLIGENEPQRAELLRSEAAGGCELDALVNDDFHHAALVCLTGRREAYYTDYGGTAEELLATTRWGFLFQGQRYHWQDNPRGTPALDIAAPRFIHCLENHDQLANSADGARVHQRTSPGQYRAMTALLLLAPQTPMLFQGQEYGATTPFLYFNDCAADAQEVVRHGRFKFLKQFPSLALEEVQARLPDPCAEQTYVRSQLDPGERAKRGPIYQLHQDLLRLRRADRVLRVHDAAIMHGSTLGPRALLLRFLPPGDDTRLLVLNFGGAARFNSISTPLAAPPLAERWEVLWSSDDPRYGGPATPAVVTASGWCIPAESAIILQPVDTVTKA